MTLAAKNAFSRMYRECGICGALGPLDQGCSEESAMVYWWGGKAGKQKLGGLSRKKVRGWREGYELSIEFSSTLGPTRSRGAATRKQEGSPSRPDSVCRVTSHQS